MIRYRLLRLSLNCPRLPDPGGGIVVLKILLVASGLCSVPVVAPESVLESVLEVVPAHRREAVFEKPAAVSELAVVALEFAAAVAVAVAVAAAELVGVED